jgi:hypothetical protein
MSLSSRSKLIEDSEEFIEVGFLQSFGDVGAHGDRLTVGAVKQGISGCDADSGVFALQSFGEDFNTAAGVFLGLGGNAFGATGWVTGLSGLPGDETTGSIGH